MRRVSSALLAVVPFLIAGCIQSPAEGPTASMDPDQAMLDSGEESLLYILTADSGALAPIQGEPGSYALSLLAPSERVVYFSDRPQRDTGTMSIDEFIESVYGAGEPMPNAGLVAQLPEGIRRVTLAFELSEPSYLAGGPLFFKAQLVEAASAGLAHLEFDDVAAVPGLFGQAELFVDSDHYNKCYGEIDNDSPYVFTLTLQDPASDALWSNIPQTLSTYTTKTVTFRFHGDADNGKLDYVANDDGAHELSIRLRCSNGNSTDTPPQAQGVCVTAHNSPFKCHDHGIGGQSHTFKVSV